MTVVLDTTVIVDVLRGEPGAVDFIQALEYLPSCSEVTRIEITRGLRSAEREPAEGIFSALLWVPVDEGIARRAGTLGRRWRRSHPGISIADLAVAATADWLGADLATANVKHFPMFADLRRPY